ncbi:MAG: hypothetical protein CVV25_13590 [Ignavibacteriae bacterium HGW-Ignavibacteriae-4]|jgi:uncharacterized protein with HEPN domain|nr:MAG: hypothetical protein CVV25_13590 [Ignavibacteriae bacterium HGW-Ignavibacteriae-4]
MSNRNDKLLLEDILEASSKILDYTVNMNLDSFFNDEKTKDAVARNFEIIGEASNRISESVKKKNQDIDWIRLRGFRNRIVHDYFGVDFTIVWSIIENNLEELNDKVKQILSNFK